MRKQKRILALSAVLVAAMLGAPTLYARDSHEQSGSAKRGGIMGQTSQMMNGCSTMMQGGLSGHRPNDQWRKDAPVKPDSPVKPDKE